jgi:hypothetical protein
MSEIAGKWVRCVLAVSATASSEDTPLSAWMPAGFLQKLIQRAHITIAIAAS